MDYAQLEKRQGRSWLSRIYAHPVIQYRFRHEYCAPNYRLFNILSNCHESGIMVYPRYSKATGSTEGYLCHLSGNISPQDIANVPVGQWIDLEFKSINLVSRIPTASDYPDYYNLITSNGDNITTTNGKNITVRKH